MSALLLYATIGTAGVVLCAHIVLAARRELEVSAAAWGEAAPKADHLRPAADLLAFAAAHASLAPHGARAVVQSYCGVARATLDAASRVARLSQALEVDGTRSPSWWLQRARLSLRLRWMGERAVWLGRFGLLGRVVGLAAELLRLDAELRASLANAPRRGDRAVDRE